MTSHSDSENNHHHRSLPHSEDMEKGLLCSMILSRDVREHCIAHIPPVAFFIPAYAIIFRALCAWHKTGRPLDFPSFKLQLTEEGQLEEIGGPEHLDHVWSFVLTSASWRHYADKLLDHYRRRVVIDQCEALRNAMYDIHLETDQTIQARAESVFTKLAVRAEPEEKPFKTLVLETFDILQERARQVNVSGVLF